MAEKSTEYSCRVFFLARGLDLDPGQVTAALRMKPNQAWRRGENNPALDHHHRYGFGGWKKHLPKSVQQGDVERQVRFWVRRLEIATLPLPRSAGVEELALSCLVQTSAIASLILDSDLLRRIARLGLEMQISIFVD